jgi:hypothetical protein
MLWILVRPLCGLTILNSLIFSHFALMLSIATDWAQARASRYASPAMSKFRETLSALGAADPACPLEPLTWGIAVLLDDMQRLV